MTITFDSVALTNPTPFEEVHGITITETLLLSGKTKIQSSATHRKKVGFDCLTETYTDISNLRAKIGTKAILSIDGDTCNAYITSFTETEIYPNRWQYAVEFTEDNT
ncbi:MAG: hypothetical protein KAJ03_02780 [Gammaproteobacteria bacterium]|nr:hypothetical protein [Gammaproteobacteria bacterium]